MDRPERRAAPPGVCVQKLHLVGFTTDLDGLIFSTRRGAKSGGFVLDLDDDLLRVVDDARRLRDGTLSEDEAGELVTDLELEGEGELATVLRPRSVSSRSALSPREMQDRLRTGRSIADVAEEAGTDEEWVTKFAAPILAEQRRTVERVRELVYDKPRFGPSSAPLDRSVRRNVAERGVRLAEDEFDAGWSAFQLDEDEWVIRFRYTSRGRAQVAEWAYDAVTGELRSHNRLGAQLGHLGRSRRRAAVAEGSEGEPRRAGGSSRPTSASTGRKAATRKATTKKATAKKATTKKATAKKKASARKASARKATAKKAAPKKAAPKKAAPKKATAKKATAKKAAPKKAAAKKATAKKATPRKAGAKKATTKKTGAKKAPPRTSATRAYAGTAPSPSGRGVPPPAPRATSSTGGARGPVTRRPPTAGAPTSTRAPLAPRPPWPATPRPAAAASSGAQSAAPELRTSGQAVGEQRRPYDERTPGAPAVPSAEPASASVPARTTAPGDGAHEGRPAPVPEPAADLRQRQPSPQPPPAPSEPAPRQARPRPAPPPTGPPRGSWRGDDGRPRVSRDQGGSPGAGQGAAVAEQPSLRRAPAPVAGPPPTSAAGEAMPMVKRIDSRRRFGGPRRGGGDEPDVMQAPRPSTEGDEIEQHVEPGPGVARFRADLARPASAHAAPPPESPRERLRRRRPLRGR